VIEEFNQFLSANKSVSTIDNRGKVDSLSAMTEALKAMPQYQDMKKKVGALVGASGDRERERDRPDLRCYSIRSTRCIWRWHRNAWTSSTKMA